MHLHPKETPTPRVVDIQEKDVPKSTIDTKTYVIAGGPCSGKTTLLNQLKVHGYTVEYEPAEELLKKEIALGHSVEDVRQDPMEWQHRVVQADVELFKSIAPNALTFVDTSLIETLVFCQRIGMDFGKHLRNYLDRFRFAGVFFLEPLERYESTDIRMEDQSTSHSLGTEILNTYRHFGYNPHRISPVPSTNLHNRLQLILQMLPSEKMN